MAAPDDATPQPQAAASTPPPPRVSRSAADETSAIAASLKNRSLRRRSILHVLSGKGKKAKAKVNAEDGDEPDGRGSDAEEDEDESTLRAIVEEGQRMKAEMQEAVEVLKGGKRVDVDEGDLREGEGEPRQEYVWDGACSSGERWRTG